MSGERKAYSRRDFVAMGAKVSTAGFAGVAALGAVPEMGRFSGRAVAAVHAGESSAGFKVFAAEVTEVRGVSDLVVIDAAAPASAIPATPRGFPAEWLFQAGDVVLATRNESGRVEAWPLVEAGLADEAALEEVLESPGTAATVGGKVVTSQRATIAAGVADGGEAVYWTTGNRAGRPVEVIAARAAP